MPPADLPAADHRAAELGVLPPVGFTFLRYVLASVTLLALLRWRPARSACRRRDRPTRVSAAAAADDGLAPPIRPREPGEPPLAILIDYDGTIALTDVGDTLMAELRTATWEAATARYDAGLVGSRRLMEWEVGLWEPDPAAMATLAAAQPHDLTFVPFVNRARAAGIPVEVVSDGFGFFIRPALERLGVGDLPIVTARTTFDATGRPSIAFPNGHPACFVCGTCKRNRVLAHQAAGRAVVFIGDGESDRYAAGYSDIVFAKRSLLRLCVESGWPFRRWTDFAEIEDWLRSTLTAWRADPTTLPGPQARPYFCGPEIWGDGRVDPPPGDLTSRR